MMSFASTPQLRELTTAIRHGLQKYGLWGIGADDKAYCDDLWLNICAYMWASKYGVAVFEDMEARHTNPNIALEYGYMTALGKRTLLLKEQRMPRLPTDITGKLWKPFSAFNISSTITATIDTWAIDLGLSPIEKASQRYLPEVALAPMMKAAIMSHLEQAMAKTPDAKALLKIQETLYRLDTEGDPKAALRALALLYGQLDQYIRAEDREDYSGLLRFRE